MELKVLISKRFNAIWYYSIKISKDKIENFLRSIKNMLSEEQLQKITYMEISCETSIF